MHVARLAQRLQQRHLGDGQPRVAEEGEPRWQVQLRSVGPEQFQCPLVAHVGRWVGDPHHQPSPQRGLPSQVVVEGLTGAVRVATVPPVGHQGRALHGVRREQCGQPAGHGIAPVAPHQCLVTVESMAEVGGEGGAPRLVETRVDGLQERPDQPVGIPRVVALTPEEERHQGPRAQEADAGADPVVTGGTGAEPVRQPLREPPFDTFGRHHDNIAGEGVLERCGQQVRQPVGEHVGSRGAMDPETHRGSIARSTDSVRPDDNHPMHRRTAAPLREGRRGT